MSQQTLFAPEPVTLVHDREGGMRYLPESIPSVIADRWFEEVLGNVGWLSQQRMMYEREVAVPRLLATFASESADLPAPLAEAFEAVRAIVGAPFNRVGLNLYRDGHDSVALHSDKTDKLLPGQPIAIVSLGASRRMSIRPKAAASHTGSYGAGHKPGYSATHTAEHTAERNAGGVAGHNASAASRILHVELEPGSCLVMSYASQFTHEHGIPKLASASGPRISLAFRCFNEQG